MNFWDVHGLFFGLFFLFFITILPRFTMFFFTVFGSGFIYWIGWFFIPRITCAIIATILYYPNNQFLLVLAWILAIFGEFLEKIKLKEKLK